MKATQHETSFDQDPQLGGFMPVLSSGDYTHVGQRVYATGPGCNDRASLSDDNRN